MSYGKRVKMKHLMNILDMWRRRLNYFNVKTVLFNDTIMNKCGNYWELKQKNVGVTFCNVVSLVVGRLSQVCHG